MRSDKLRSDQIRSDIVRWVDMRWETSVRCEQERNANLPKSVAASLASHGIVELQVPVPGRSPGAQWWAETYRSGLMNLYTQIRNREWEQIGCVFNMFGVREWAGVWEEEGNGGESIAGTIETGTNIHEQRTYTRRTHVNLYTLEDGPHPCDWPYQERVYTLSSIIRNAYKKAAGCWQADRALARFLIPRGARKKWSNNINFLYCMIHAVRLWF